MVEVLLELNARFITHLFFFIILVRHGRYLCTKAPVPGWCRTSLRSSIVLLLRLLFYDALPSKL
jgi:hypothetical protein